MPQPLQSLSTSIGIGGASSTKPDAEEFSRVLAKDFSFIEDRYYVSLVHDPKVRVGKGRITVTFDLEDGTSQLCHLPL